MIYKKTSLSKITHTLWIAGIVLLGGVLFYVSLEARHAEETYHRTLNEIQQEQETINVLEAEIAYLTRPERIQKLSNKYLKMHFPTQEEFIDLDTIPDNIIALSQLETAAGSFVPPVPHRHPNALQAGYLVTP